jgi:hypothetical protein
VSERRHPPSLTPPGPIHVGEGEIDKQELALWTEDVSRILKKLCRHQTAAFDSLPAPHASSHDADGDDPLTTPDAPTTITADATAAAGDGPSYAYEDHTHGISAAAPSAIALANTAGSPSEGAATSFARSDHAHGSIKRDIRVAKAGTDIGTRNRLNLIQGANIVLTVTDDAGNDEVDVTIEAEDGLPTADASNANAVGYPKVLTADTVPGFYPPWWPHTSGDALTHDTFASVLDIDLPDGAFTARFISYTVHATNGTDYHIETGILCLTSINKAGAYTSTTDKVFSKFSRTDGASTLTVTFNVITGTNEITLQVKGATSFGTPTIQFFSHMGAGPDDFQEVTWVFQP